MFYEAKNGTLSIAGITTDYIAFGSGRPLIFLTGLGDGLKTVKNTALPFGLMYRRFAKNHRVYAISRPNLLEPGCSTRDMAAHVRQSMALLGIETADILGVSQGGMIAQHLAADNPEAVDKLVLVATASCPNALMEACIPRWMELARRGRFGELMRDNIRLMYSEDYYRKNGWLAPIAAKLSKPSSFDRFLIMAQACLEHNCHEKLPLIRSETLVIGGELDQVLGGQASRDIAELISSSALVMYPHLGHALYDEAKDFQQVVLSFLDQ